MKSGKIKIKIKNICTINFLMNLFQFSLLNIPDFTAVFSIASCSSTWEIFEHVRRERLLLLAITDPDCPRLPLHEALTVTKMTAFPFCRKK